MLCPVTTLAVLGTACGQPLFSIIMENKGDRAAVLEKTQAGALLTAGLPAGAAKALEEAVGRWRAANAPSAAASAGCPHGWALTWGW